MNAQTDGLQTDGIENWDEVRTAYHVARLGTLSAAAAFLDVHHATVIRHIDALEARLGTKLFQRHPRGYTPTESGRDLLAVAATTEDLLSQFAGRVKGRGAAVSGELVVTTVTSAATFLTPVMAEFRELHPEITFRVISENRRLRLEYGEAHVALRAGATPHEPDNIAQNLSVLGVGLYAHETFVQRNGLPKSEEDLAEFDFVGPEGSGNAPHNKWLAANIPANSVVFRSNEVRGTIEAVRCGIGIGFVPRMEVKPGDGLVQVMPPRAEWSANLWLVTHVDLHRTAKVQAFADFLKLKSKSWE